MGFCGEEVTLIVRMTEESTVTTIQTHAGMTGSTYDGFLAHRALGDIAVDEVSDGVWRVSDRRLDEHDAPSVLGVIERLDDHFEVLEIGHARFRRRAETLDEAVRRFVV